MTEERLSEIEARASAAFNANADEWELTPAGWEGIGHMLRHKREGWNVAWFWSDWDEPDMQAFIELFRHSRQDVPDLVAEVRRLRAALEAERRSCLAVIEQRDISEETITECARILGCEEEWSNLHDHHACLLELAEQAMSREETPG